MSTVNKGIRKVWYAFDMKSLSQKAQEQAQRLVPSPNRSLGLHEPGRSLSSLKPLVLFLQVKWGCPHSRYLRDVVNLQLLKQTAFHSREQLQHFGSRVTETFDIRVCLRSSLCPTSPRQHFCTVHQH